MDENKPTNQSEKENIVFTSFRSEGGFIWNVTVRRDTQPELRLAMNQLEIEVENHEGSPVEDYRFQGNGRKAPAKAELPAGMDKTDAEFIDKELEKASGKCQQCGGQATYREGVGKSGKPYKGYFCNDRSCGHVSWLK